MNKLYTVILALLLISCNQDKKREAPEVTDQKGTTDTVVIKEQAIPAEPDNTINNNPDNPIADIRRVVEHINTTKLDKKHFEFMCDEKMMVDYFFDEGKIVKISVDFGTVGDVYAKEDYYYKNAQLVFKYEFVEGGPACEGCIKTNEYRSYIKTTRLSNI